MTTILLTMILAQSPTSAKFKATAGILAGAAVVDVLQSTPCVQSGACKELNPVFRPIIDSYAKSFALKAAVTGAVIFYTARMHRAGHHKSAWVLLGFATSVQLGAVIWNQRMGR